MLAALSNQRDENLRDFALTFLSEELPKELRPTDREKSVQVALVWGADQFIEVLEIPPGESLTVGNGRMARLSVAHSSLGAATLILTPNGRGFRLLLPKGANARVRSGEHERTPDELIAASEANAVDVPVRGAMCDLGLDDRVSMRFGDLRLLARYVRPQASTKRPLIQRLDIDFIVTLIVMLLVAFAAERMIAVANLSRVDTDDDLMKHKDEYRKYVAVEQPPPPKPKKIEQLPGNLIHQKDPPIRFGAPDQPKNAKPPVGANRIDANKEEVNRRAVARALDWTSGMEQVLAIPSDELTNSIGKIQGPGVADNGPGDGSDLPRGDPHGGIHGLDIGPPGGPPGIDHSRGHDGEWVLGNHPKHATQFTQPITHVVGGLSADEVGRIIRRHWNEIKYCYERELSKDPNLSGKVGVSFEIGPVGDVVRAGVEESDLHSPATESCIVGNVNRWKFPVPRGGGVVDVNYPFIFRSGG